MTPEEKARQKIDAMLTASGWVVQTKDKINLSAARGVAICELTFKTGEPDYTLFVDAKAIGTVEAKPEGKTLTGVEEQSAKYVAGIPFGIAAWKSPLPFCYESTGAETFFTSRLDPDHRSRRVFSFHRPETLLTWVQQEKSVAQRLREFPALAAGTLWPAQIEAITELEKSFGRGDRRALIQMATGSGKTYTAVNSIYRLVKYAGAKRVLFLVDRGNLGRQTLKEFQQFVSPANNYKFTEEYIVQHLTGNSLDTSARVVIGTIQRVYSMLKGEKEPAPDLDDLPIEAAESLFKKPVPVEYNPAFPIEEFDFIITDECHRSIYNLWRQVLEYFDASLIGLTATPSKQTFGFFQQNLVMEYNHESAVADGVNVGCDIYRIKTQITQGGSKVEAGFFVDKRDRQTRKVRWEQLDEVLTYDAADLDRDVVATDQIRTVLTTFRDKVFTEMFPGRTDLPKTLIFAKDDRGQTLSQISKAMLAAIDPDKVEEASRLLAIEAQRRDAASTFLPLNYFDPEASIAFLSGDLPHWRQEGTTYFVTFRLADSLPQERLQQWREEREKWLAEHPEPHDEATRREYYERFPQRLQQWLDAGSGSCALAIPEMKQLVEGALRHFDGQRYRLHDFVVAPNHVHVIVSPSGEHTLSEILHSWKSFTAHEMLKVVKSGGAVPALNFENNTVWQKESFDHIVRSPASMEKFCEYIRNHGGSGSGQRGSDVPPLISYVEPTDKQRRDAAATLIQQALAPLAANPDLRNLLKKIQKAADQTIDIISRDSLIYAGPAEKSTQTSAQLATSFREYIEQNKAEITALQILYSRPYQQRLTEPMLKELEKKLRDNHAAWTEDRLWDAFAVTAPGKVRGRSQAGRFADLVALVRFALEQQPVLAPFADSVSERFNEWLMDKAKAGAVFTPEQLSWLHLIREHIATAISIEPEDLERTPFNQRGGLGKAHQLFGEQLPKLLDELNEVLAA